MKDQPNLGVETRMLMVVINHMRATWHVEDTAGHLGRSFGLKVGASTGEKDRPLETSIITAFSRVE
jgi:hypothetical protein